MMKQARLNLFVLPITIFAISLPADDADNQLTCHRVFEKILLSSLAMDA